MREEKGKKREKKNTKERRAVGEKKNTENRGSVFPSPVLL